MMLAFFATWCKVAQLFTIYEKSCWKIRKRDLQKHQAHFLILISSTEKRLLNNLWISVISERRKFNSMSQYSLFLSSFSWLTFVRRHSLVLLFFWETEKNGIPKQMRKTFVYSSLIILHALLPSSLFVRTSFCIWFGSITKRKLEANLCFSRTETVKITNWRRLNRPKIENITI